MNENDRQHIEAICRRNGIVIITPEEHRKAKMGNLLAGRFVPPDESPCNVGRMKPDGTTEYGVWLGDPDTTDEGKYFVALHEIGHCMLNHGPELAEAARKLGGPVDHEIAAWEWAFDHAQYFPSDETCCYCMDMLATYTDQNCIPNFWDHPAVRDYKPKEQTMKPNDQITKLITERLGFSKQDAENIQNNLAVLSLQMTMIDSTLKALDVPAVRGLNKFAAEAKANGAQIGGGPDTMEQMEMLCGFAEKYQARFGKGDDEPQINAFPTKAVTA